MKFGEAFTEYLDNERERFSILEKCSHVEYKRFKKVLKSCQSCKLDEEHDDPLPPAQQTQHQISCQCLSCPVCDQTFFTELMKEASDIAVCFNLKARHLLHLHVASGIQRYLLRIRKCFKYDRQTMVEEGRMLIEYATMNAVAIRKILKKYDKVHCSENGQHFKSKLRAEHVELLQSPWLIELGAFYLNLEGSNDGEFNELSSHFTCDLDGTPPILALILPDSLKIEYDLTCAICLETVFNPYALSCGHLFCKSCACSAGSVYIFQGPKAANSCSKCPICRETGVYATAVHMLELDLLLKTRCKDYWKERYNAERSETVKQNRVFWDLQAHHSLN